jgi:hypothetical protein
MMDHHGLERREVAAADGEAPAAHRDGQRRVSNQRIIACLKGYAEHGSIDPDLPPGCRVKRIRDPTPGVHTITGRPVLGVGRDRS